MNINDACFSGLGDGLYDCSTVTPTPCDGSVCTNGGISGAQTEISIWMDGQTSMTDQCICYGTETFVFSDDDKICTDTFTI